MRSILILSILAIISFPTVADSSENTRKVEIFAHRGILEEVPENTFAALRRAVESGVDGIEVDIRKTKDNQLILMCDETIDRTTNGKGRVDQLLYTEIQRYDAGSWRGSEFRNEQVPLLSDVLKFCKINNFKLILNARQICIEKQVMDLVKSHEMSPQVYFWGTLKNLTVEEPDLYIKELVLMSPEEITEEKISQIHDEKMLAFTTILNSDNKKIIKDRIKMGVDVILIDYPCVALDILGIKSRILTNKNPWKNTGKEINNFQQEEIDNPAFIQKKIKSLIKTLEDADYDKARNAAMVFMILPQKYTVPPLIKLLKDNRFYAKQNAIWALGFCGTKDVAPYIQPLLRDKNPDVRREAILALGRLGDTRSVPLLIEMLKTETGLEVKYDMVRTLGTLADRDAVFTLHNILTKEKYWYIKSAAVEALTHVYNDKTASVLARVLTTDAGEDAIWARTNAAWALASMGKESVPQLINALRDNEEATRRRAEWALIKIGPPAVKSLISLLRDPNKFARERAAQAIGWIEDESAVTTLIWTLKDTEPSVVYSAAWALGRIGNPEALPALKSLVNTRNNDIREQVDVAIERIMASKENMVYYKKPPQKP